MIFINSAILLTTLMPIKVYYMVQCMVVGFLVLSYYQSKTFIYLIYSDI